VTYDAENRTVTSSNGSSSAYVYDGNGLRVKKCVPNCSSPTTTTRYIFSGSIGIPEFVNTDKIVKRCRPDSVDGRVVKSSNLKS
jgi:YD repeat-containing protein